MPASMHKLLVHSGQIIANFELPIGMYTEEAQEARNKDSKHIREHHTRKISRILTITDQFNQLHVTSDPIVSSYSFQNSKKKKKILPKDASQIAGLMADDTSNFVEYDSQSYESNEETPNYDPLQSLSQEIQEIEMNESNEIESLINSESNVVKDLEDFEL